MTVETDRLILIPLTVRQLDLWLNDIPALEAELNCQYRGEPLEGVFLDIVKGQLSAAENDADNYIYHSFWFIVRRKDAVVVGSADFKAPPDKNGQVEIGYGLGKEYEGSGYMAEAVRAMCGWAAKQESIRRIIAETEPGNEKSEAVLKRNGFSLQSQDETAWWSLDIKERVSEEQ
jgi:RimJ/RimL family protein N-acetyltransferase